MCVFKMSRNDNGISEYISLQRSSSSIGLYCQRIKVQCQEYLLLKPVIYSNLSKFMVQDDVTCNIFVCLTAYMYNDVKGYDIPI